MDFEFTLPICHLRDVACERDGVSEIGPWEFPWVDFFQPILRLLDLLALLDRLTEHAIFVANAVPHASIAERCHRLEKTSGKAAESTVAERRLCLNLPQI